MIARYLAIVSWQWDLFDCILRLHLNVQFVPTIPMNPLQHIGRLQKSETCCELRGDLISLTFCFLCNLMFALNVGGESVKIVGVNLAAVS